jgi:hypothetical protein
MIEDASHHGRGTKLQLFATISSKKSQLNLADKEQLCLLAKSKGADSIRNSPFRASGNS